MHTVADAVQDRIAEEAHATELGLTMRTVAGALQGRTDEEARASELGLTMNTVADALQGRTAEEAHAIELGLTMDTVAGALRVGVRALRGRSETPRLDAEILLSTLLDVSRSALIARDTDPIAEDHRQAYADLLARRAHGAPISYLTGAREFWSLNLNVTPDVLVPRPETELLVEIALTLCPKDTSRRVLDLGTGSGAVALAIAAERPRAHVTATDISAAALAVARENGRKLALRRVEWRLGSWFEAIPRERFDVIVANPPYVAADDPALAELAAEPRIALASGPAGLDALTAIIDGAARHLLPDGWLLLEHGNTQAGAVAGMLGRRSFRAIRTHADYSGNPRVTLARVPLDLGQADVDPGAVGPDALACDALACDALACDALACDALASDALACDALACDALACDALAGSAVAPDIFGRLDRAPGAVSPGAARPDALARGDLAPGAVPPAAAVRPDALGPGDPG